MIDTQPNPAPRPNGVVQVQVVTTLRDPFEALLIANGNERHAAELMGCHSTADFYRMLERSDPEKFHRGLQAKLAVTLSQLVTTVQGRVIERLEDNENPVSDKTLVDILTKTIPALTGMVQGMTAPNPNSGNSGGTAELLASLYNFAKSVPPEIRQSLLGELGDMDGN